MEAAFASIELAAVGEVAFGDLFLEDIRAYRESRARSSRQARPLSRLGPRHCGARAALPRRRLPRDPRLRRPARARSLLGPRDYDERLLAELPAGVDPCGENGEFHTFVTAGPVFAQPIACRRGEVVEREGFVFCDLLDDA